ncbi:CutC family-domain-containing protein [Phlebopus sp. FC_14]|nr:CutC family-domain-containing protein [Phlebopus sp. FC_14]
MSRLPHFTCNLNPRQRLTMEVCVDSVESALAAVRGGADRIELCGNLGLGGGTTPTIGLLRSVQNAVPNIPIMASVMIRPRTGDFVYSEPELQVMLEDIYAFAQHNIQGVVFGVLTSDGSIDIGKTQRLVSAALPLEVCFHRAFDMTADVKAGWNQLVQVHGITRVLTSGHCRNAIFPEAIETLANLLNAANALVTGTNTVPIGVLPGSGVNAATASTLCEALLSHGLKEIHLSGGKWIDGASTHRCEGMGMGAGGAGEWGIWRTDEHEIRMVREIIDKVCSCMG